MKIGGFQKTSLLDYPDMISSIVWTVGCNFNCPFCYNTELVHGTTQCISGEQIFDHLKKRKGIVEALVISGGEPFLYPRFVELVEALTEKHYVSINTNLSRSNAYDFANVIPPEKILYIHASLHIMERERRKIHL